MSISTVGILLNFHDKAPHLIDAAVAALREIATHAGLHAMNFYESGDSCFGVVCRRQEVAESSPWWRRDRLSSVIEHTTAFLPSSDNYRHEHVEW